jgi:hypothetical protein
MSWYVHISFWNSILEHEVDNHDEIIMNLNTKKITSTNFW